jgi:hypothetical protein
MAVTGVTCALMTRIFSLRHDFHVKRFHGCAEPGSQVSHAKLRHQSGKRRRPGDLHHDRIAMEVQRSGFVVSFTGNASLGQGIPRLEICKCFF